MIYFYYDEDGEEKLKEFLDILNRYHPTIKFTSKYSREKIDFVDVEILKEGNRLLTDIFVRSADTNQYLHATSCHAYQSKNPHRTVLQLYVLTGVAPRINFFIRGAMM